MNRFSPHSLFALIEWRVMVWLSLPVECQPLLELLRGYALLNQLNRLPLESHGFFKMSRFGVRGSEGIQVTCALPIT